MSLTLIVGPMKSGKSLELIARVAPYEFAGKKVVYIQPERDVRGEGVISRLGLRTKALRVKSLSEVPNSFDVIGIDEVHMFKSADMGRVAQWLAKGKQVFASGLDMDYRGRLILALQRLLELKPDEIITKKSVCEVCRNYNAQYTQVLSNGKPVLAGLPPVIPDNGTYAYEARCRRCFVFPK
jgi:thymidine kinase